MAFGHLSMKRIFILLLVLISLGAKCAVDPAPPHIALNIDNNIRNKAAYISIISYDQDNKTQNYDKSCIIEPEVDNYFIVFSGDLFKIKIKFKDSTEKYTSVIQRKTRYSNYIVSLSPEGNISFTDNTDHLKNNALINFLFYAFLFFLLIKLLPTFIIIFPKDLLNFIKCYGLIQIVYFIAFAFLTFFFHDKGMLISIFLLLIALIIDYRILNKNYLNTKGKARVFGSIILSAILTFVFCLFVMLASIILNI